jgi:hypothetical protein
MVMLQSPGHRWPSFNMQPEGKLLKLVLMLGLPDINFDDAPEFSKNYFLYGEDEAAVRRLFNPKVTDALGRQTGWCIEAHGDTVLIWRQETRVGPDDLRPLLDNATVLYRLLRGD